MRTLVILAALAAVEGPSRARSARNRGSPASRWVPAPLAIDLYARSWTTTTDLGRNERAHHSNGDREPLASREIQAELMKLGIRVSLSTVSRYVPKTKPDTGQQQRWITFLRNHKDVIAGMDFFVVPTVRFQLLYVWFAIDHGRRRILHFNVTTSPSARWVGCPDSSGGRRLDFAAIILRRGRDGPKGLPAGVSATHSGAD
jgi:hypothetical protein